MLLEAVGRHDGKWKYGAVKTSERGGSATSDWKHRIKECGLILDHAPALAREVVDGNLALDAGPTGRT